MAKLSVCTLIENAERKPEVSSPKSERFKEIAKIMDKLCGELGTTLTSEKESSGQRNKGKTSAIFSTN